MSAVPKDRCLQCGKSREQVKNYFDSPCATASGYEVVEGLDDWERHHWRDWSDAELRRSGIKPEFFNEHRRDDWYDLPYAPCEHTGRGHSFPERDEYFEKWLMEERGVCRACGKREESAP